ncbi:MAG: ComEA family DNA-binding protein [Eubacteriales bacterium]|nr:ComEA family DNA-binding protein [Eubacteriales bacterium]
MGNFFTCNRRKKARPARPNPEGPADQRPYFWPEEANYPGYTGPAAKKASLEAGQEHQLPYGVLILALLLLFVLLGILLGQGEGSRFSPDWQRIDLSAEEGGPGGDQEPLGLSVEDLAASRGESSLAVEKAGHTESVPNPSDSSTEEEYFPVYISGAVAQPGVYFLPPGSLLVDLIEKAGGFIDLQAPPDLNLASLLPAHAHIHVVGAEERAAGAVSQFLTGEGSTLAQELGQAVPQTLEVGISLNQASQADLEQIPGIGPKTAQAILQLRASLGREMVLDDLLQVPGIKEKRFDQIKSYFRLP